MDDYEPVFPRDSKQRRVLGFVTDTEHMGRPRDTVEVISEEMTDDPYTPFSTDEDDVRELLDDLEASGLVSQKKGVYRVTKAGMTELTN